MPITQMGIREFRGLHGDFSMPRTTQRPTVYWLGESEKPTRSNSKLAKIWLRKKKCGAFVSLTKDFIYQSRGVGETWLKETLSTAVAEGVHNALINGKGSDSEPKGILTYTSGYTSYTEATNGQRFRFDEGAKMAFLLEDANELEGANKGGFLTSPAVKNGLQRQSVLQYSGQAAADGAPIYGSPVLTPAQVDSILGYQMKTTTHISRTLTKGNNSTCSAVIFGDWKYFALGFWRAPEIKVSDIAGDGSTGSAFLDDEVYVVMLNQVDCTFLRQTAFIVAKDAQTSAIV
jgi:HK97 family phage major capsid protein